MTIDSEWMPLGTGVTAAEMRYPQEYGLAVILQKVSWAKRGGGRIEGLRSVLESEPLDVVGVMEWSIAPQYVPILLKDSAFWKWNGDDLVLLGYPVDEEKRRVSASKKFSEFGRMGASKRWGKKGTPAKRGRDDATRDDVRGAGTGEALAQLESELDKAGEEKATDEDRAEFMSFLRNKDAEKAAGEDAG